MSSPGDCDGRVQQPTLRGGKGKKPKLLDKCGHLCSCFEYFILYVDVCGLLFAGVHNVYSRDCY